MPCQKSLKTGELAKTNAEFSTTKLTRIIPIIVELLMDQGADMKERS